MPYKEPDDPTLGPIVNSDYFGTVPAERLRVNSQAIWFAGDGKFRSKIGVSQPRAKPMAGSIDLENGVLTLVHFTMPDDPTKYGYVNNNWGQQKEPYRGDVFNSYNDGPPEPGKRLWADSSSSSRSRRPRSCPRARRSRTCSRRFILRATRRRLAPSGQGRAGRGCEGRRGCRYQQVAERREALAGKSRTRACLPVMSSPVTPPAPEESRLARIYEPEVMDTTHDALDYDQMDHAEVNRRFVSDFLNALAVAGISDEIEVLDLGTGTAQIPIELCRQNANLRVVAIDLSVEMLKIAAENVARGRLGGADPA